MLMCCGLEHLQLSALNESQKMETKSVHLAE